MTFIVCVYVHYDNIAATWCLLIGGGHLGFFINVRRTKWKKFLFVQLGYIDVRNHHQSKSTWTWHRTLICYIATCTSSRGSLLLSGHQDGMNNIYLAAAAMIIWCKPNDLVQAKWLFVSRQMIWCAPKNYLVQAKWFGARQMIISCKPNDLL